MPKTRQRRPIRPAFGEKLAYPMVDRELADDIRDAAAAARCDPRTLTEDVLGIFAVGSLQDLGRRENYYARRYIHLFLAGALRVGTSPVFPAPPPKKPETYDTCASIMCQHSRSDHEHGEFHGCMRCGCTCFEEKL